MHRRAIFPGFFSKLPRSKSRSRQPVASRLGAHIKNRVTDAARCSSSDLLVPQHTQAEHIHQRIPLVALVEIHFSADCRNANAIPIMRNARNHARKQTPVVVNRRRLHIRRDRSKPQRVQIENRTRTHRKNIADNSAHPSRCTLERLHRARVIVALHFECHSPAVTDVDNPGILFARTDQHARTIRGEFAQLGLGIFIRTMFTPHHRENAQLGHVGVAPQDGSNAIILLGSDAVFCDDFLRNEFGHVGKIKPQRVAVSSRTAVRHPVNPAAARTPSPGEASSQIPFAKRCRCLRYYG